MKGSWVVYFILLNLVELGHAASLQDFCSQAFVMPAVRTAGALGFSDQAAVFGTRVTRVSGRVAGRNQRISDVKATVAKQKKLLQRWRLQLESRQAFKPQKRVAALVELLRVSASSEVVRESLSQLADLHAGPFTPEQRRHIFSAVTRYRPNDPLLVSRSDTHSTDDLFDHSAELFRIARWINFEDNNRTYFRYLLISVILSNSSGEPGLIEYKSELGASHIVSFRQADPNVANHNLKDSVGIQKTYGPEGVLYLFRNHGLELRANDIFEVVKQMSVTKRDLEGSPEGPLLYDVKSEIIEALKTSGAQEGRRGLLGYVERIRSDWPVVAD